MSDMELCLNASDFHDLIETLFKNNSFCTVKTVCKGFSMSPFIKDMDSITISPVNKGWKFNIGDVVVLPVKNKKNKIVIHRIVRTQEDSILLKGDNLFHADGWFNKNLIIGIVKDVFRNNKRLRYPSHIKFIIAVGSKTKILNCLLWGYRRIKQNVYT